MKKIGKARVRPETQCTLYNVHAIENSFYSLLTIPITTLNRKTKCFVFVFSVGLGIILYGLALLIWYTMLRTGLQEVQFSKILSYMNIKLF